MKCFVAACFSVFLCCPSQAQTADAVVGFAKSQICSQQWNDCSTQVAEDVKQPTAEQNALDKRLPDAPSSVSSDAQNAFTWDLADPKAPTKQLPRVAPLSEPIWDKKALAAQVFLAGSMIFDIEATHQGIAHHRCVEGSLVLPRHPSRGELYLDQLEVFAPTVVMEALGAMALRRAHLPRWAWKSMLYLGPTEGSPGHIRAGTKWLTQCW